MIVNYFLVILCIFVVETTADTIDCKTIDSEKFKKLFKFDYDGGSLGLKLNIGLIGNTNKFQVQNCKFELSKTRTAVYGKSNFRNHQKDKLSGLTACTKYKVMFTVKNVATSKSWEYENYVSTKPDSKVTKIELSVLEVDEDYVDFQWTAKNADCFEIYHAILKDSNNREIQNIKLLPDVRTVSFNNLESRKSYTAVIIAQHEKGSTLSSNEQKIKMKSSENYIDDIEVILNVQNVTTNTAQLIWNLTDTIDTPVTYNLEIFDQTGTNKIFNEVLTNNSIILRNLKACMEYNAKVTVVEFQKSSEKTFATGMAPPGNVTQITYQANQTHSIISWNPPEVNPTCVTNYTIKFGYLKDENATVQHTVPKDHLSKVFDRLKYSTKIYIHVYANLDTSVNATRASNIKVFENFNIDNFVVKTIQEFRLSAAEMQLSWGFDTSFIDGDVLDYFEVFFDGTAHKTKKRLLNLNIIACRTNYTIVIRCASKAGTVGPNVTYHTNLNDKEVQLSIINATDINVQQYNESLLIEWTPNVYEASCIDYYEIKFADGVFKTNVPKMEINKFDSCMLYQVLITPISIESGTKGETTQYEFETSVLAPTKPSKPQLINAGNRELIISSSISDNDKRCVGMTSTFIEFTCNNIVIEQEINRSQSQYSVKIPNLHPNSKYECVAKVKNSNGTSEKSDANEFETLQDSPQPPDEIRALVGSDNKIEVTWKENNSTGFADYYQVHVTFEKFLYEFGKNCDKNIKNLMMEATETKAESAELFPFSQYKVKVQAFNRYGKSNYSESIELNTNPSSPTEPRNVRVEIKNQENSSISAVLSWDSPCRMNGKFSLYTITVNGHRTGVDSDKRTEASSTTSIELFNLSEGFEYDIEIQAVNQNSGSSQIYGKVAKFSFETPSGSEYDFCNIIEFMKEY
ncbi:phosphatidylinositol phosphatase PTPRQ-like [Chironomus tepperi]|uniref:phosphatidylinositol phosphatase PTPRQ-like n=1 Tax=Chironomus tepperi TaxID=113505 RepID=UPI00391F2B53